MNNSLTERTSKIKRVLISGFIVRVFVVAFILTIGLSFSIPYFISDDEMYEKSAEYYLENASILVDMPLLDSIAVRYSKPFWPIFISLFAYLFRTIYIGRFLNIIFSTLCILVLYKLTKQISQDEKTAMTAARLFAYLPVVVITSCFPIKDFFIMLSVLYTFYLFVSLQNGVKIHIYQIVLCAALLTGTYFSRGAVTEFMLLLLAVFFLTRLLKKKKYVLLIVSTLAIALILFLMKDMILSSFEIKINDYSEDNGLGNGIRLVQINSWFQLYKLPATYLFATFQPMILKLGTIGNKSSWLAIIAYLNMSMYPISIGNFLYIFVKKKNLLFWISSFVIYSAVIILSLGVFRHYLFLIPVQIINYALCVKEAPRLRRYIALGSVGLLLVVLLYSLI